MCGQRTLNSLSTQLWAESSHRLPQDNQSDWQQQKQLKGGGGE